MKKNKILLHNENGITQLKINGVEVCGVSDCRIVSSTTGKTELTFTITTDNVATDLETDLVEYHKECRVGIDAEAIMKAVQKANGDTFRA